MQFLAGWMPLCFALATTPFRGPERDLLAARRAEAMLGPAVWTRVIRIRNEAARSRYPREVDALVFELEDVLWFYTATDGTQSLSRYRHHADADKRELAPLLSRVEPGFVAWEDAPAGDPAAAREDSGTLPNGCFIECIALLRQRLLAGAPTAEPRLLSYYVTLPGGGVNGHTVLQFRGQEGWMVIDPYAPRQRSRIAPQNPDDAKSCADQLRPDVAKARQWPLTQLAAGFTSCPPLARR